MIGAEIAEQIFDTEFCQAFEKIISGGEFGSIGLAGDGRGHGRSLV
jgi:hypothetical protein